MKYILILLFISLPAFAQVDLFVDGKKVIIPEGRKLVLVPKIWPTESIVRVIEDKVTEIKPKEECDPGDLAFSPTPCPFSSQ
jgi:hypothetical protein